MNNAEATLELMRDWWNSLTPVKGNNGLPAKGTVAGALVVLDRLKTEYNLDLNHHRAKKGQSQIEGAGKARTQRILEHFGETRVFVKEGGRTNRGLAGDIAMLLEALGRAGLERLAVEERNQILTQLQGYLAQKVGEYFGRERLKFIYSPARSTWQHVHDILETARQNGKEGQVAQYLVGAKLALRFPELSIRNDSYSASDIPSGSPGDFVINDTVFHVTVAPNQGHFDKCKRNVESGYRVHLVVPERISTGARQNAENTLTGQITIHSIESFVAQNLEELSVFANDKLTSGFAELLKLYNRRVGAIEADKSLLIEIPRNLAGL